jgi:hypothetical protein
MDGGRGPNNSDLGAAMPGSCHHLIDMDVPRTSGAYFFSGEIIQRAQGIPKGRGVLNTAAASTGARRAGAATEGLFSIGPKTHFREGPKTISSRGLSGGQPSPSRLLVC